MSVFLVLGSPELETSLGVTSSVLSRGDLLSHLLATLCQMKSEDTIHFLYHKGPSMAHFQLDVHWDQVLFCQDAFQLGGLQDVLLPGVVLPRCRILQSSLFSCMRFLSARFFCLLQFLWMTTQSSTASATPPPSCVVSKFPEGTLCLSSRSLMKMLNETGPGIDPWGMLSVPGLQPAWHWSPAAIQPVFSASHSCSSSPYINSFSMRILQLLHPAVLSLQLQKVLLIDTCFLHI